MNLIKYKLIINSVKTKYIFMYYYEENEFCCLQIDREGHKKVVVPYQRSLEQLVWTSNDPKFLVLKRVS